MYNLNPIGHAETPFVEKFGIPRQASLLENIDSSILLKSEVHSLDSLDGLRAGDLLWVISYFHLSKSHSSKVKAPRSGGNKKVGVFATRSPSRPNPLGLSLVRIKGIEFDKKKCRILTTGLDLVNRTPILDIKPYLSYSDFGKSQSPQWVQENEFTKPSAIEYEPLFLSKLDGFIKHELDLLLNLLDVVFLEDPRPAYQRESERIYFSSFYRWNIAWKIKENIVYVIDIADLN